MSESNGRALHARKSGTREEHELLARARKRDERAQAELVRRYAPLVRRVARGIHGRRGMDDLDDLYQVGMVGLLEAIDRFEPERGAFAPYASATVSGMIKRHLRDRSWRMRLGRSLHDAIQVVGPAAAALESTLGRAPTEAELALRTGLSPELVSEAQRAVAASQPVSLEAPAGDGASTFSELIGGEDPGLERAEDRLSIARGTAGLGPEERELLTRRFALEQTQTEIAGAMGGSQMSVSRRLRRVLTEVEGRLSA